MNAKNCLRNGSNVFAASLWIVAATTGIARAQLPDRGPLETATGEEMIDFLQDQGYRAQLEADSQGDPRIVSSTQGVRFTVDFYECNREAPRRCGSLQILSSFDLPEGMSAEQINAWNAQFRFGQASIDTEGDPILRLDIELDGGISPDNLQEWLNRWETSLSSFLEHIGWRTSAASPARALAFGAVLED